MNVKLVNIITRTNDSKTLVTHLLRKCRLNLIAQYVIQIKNEIMTNMSVKSIGRAKNINFGILAHVLVSIASIKKVLLMI